MTLDVTIGGYSADSFASLAEYTDRASAMGWTLVASTTTQEQNLRRACVALNTMWLQKAYGFRQYKLQTLEFPRLYMPLVKGWQILPDTIPQDIKNAQMELAYLIQNGADPLATLTATISEKTVKAGPVESTTKYLGGLGIPQFRVVSLILRPYLQSSDGQAMMARA